VCYRPCQAAHRRPRRCPLAASRIQGSETPDIADVDETGLVTATGKAFGTARITASADSAAGSAAVDVVLSEPSSFVTEPGWPR